MAMTALSGVVVGTAANQAVLLGGRMFAGCALAVQLQTVDACPDAAESAFVQLFK